MTTTAWQLVRRTFKALSNRVVAGLPPAVRDPLILNRIQADTSELGDVVVKIAETRDEHEQAAHLLFDAYVETGLVVGAGVPVRVTSFLMMPSTVRFVAVVRGEVIATLSLIPDSGLGLPLEASARDAVNRLRGRGGLIAEIGALAVKPGHRGHGLTMLLYKAMWRTAVELLGVRHLVVSVRPSIEMFYAATLRFVRLTEDVITYSGILTELRVLYLDLERAPETFERAFANSPAGRFNPLEFFCHAPCPQIVLPRSLDELDPLRTCHARSAMRLAVLRPEVVMNLAPAEFDSLRGALASVRGMQGGHNGTQSSNDSYAA